MAKEFMMSKYYGDFPSIHLFGSATSSGQSLVNQFESGSHTSSIYAYSRQSKANFVDFSKPASFILSGDPSASAIWISFGPIWLFAPFIKHLASSSPESLSGIKGVIACSSSSAITKRFAFNSFDRELVPRLINAEEQLLDACQRLQVPCRIVRPTLIYGQAGSFGDCNLSRLLQKLRCFRVLPLPAQSGLRQPIHASQLAAVALSLAQQLAAPCLDPSPHECIAVGGDVTLSYAEMISALQEAQPPNDPARHCRLQLIPNRLFFLLAVPLLLRSPKAFEAVLRMGANLSGFIPAHQLMGCEPKPFPVLPLV